MNASKSSKPREKEMRRSPGNGERDRRGSAKSNRKEPLKRDQSSCYMSRIRLMPVKFWWFDPFQMFKIFNNSIIKCLMFYENWVELNGLDQVQVKEKLLNKFKYGEVWIVHPYSISIRVISELPY
ncbi:hypothetical protein Hanom_Chr15g01347861 [Helianthus anomalus]